jgi:hypothetical protein
MHTLSFFLEQKAPDCWRRIREGEQFDALDILEKHKKEIDGFISSMIPPGRAKRQRFNEINEAGEILRRMMSAFHNTTPHTPPLPPGVVSAGISGIAGFALFAAEANVIQDKINKVREAMYMPFPEDGLVMPRAWQITERIFFLFDVISLPEFLDRFDTHSSWCLLSQAAAMTESEDQAAVRKQAEHERRDALIRALQKAADERHVMFFADGWKLLADRSADPRAWAGAWLKTKEFAAWLVRDSGIPTGWIPLVIRRWTKDNMPAPAAPGAAAPGAVQAAPASGEGKDVQAGGKEAGGDDKAKVVFEFNDKNKLIALFVNGQCKDTSGRFSWAARLIDTLSKSSGRRMLKTHFDKIHPGVRSKAKQQLGDKIGWNVLPTVYKDDKDSIELTEAISVKRA